MHTARCLTRLFPCDSGGCHGVVLGGVVAVVIFDSGGSRLEARVYIVHRALPLFHLRHAAVTLTH